ANLCASPELIATPPLRGGEEAALLNLQPDGGATIFLLPKVGVSIEFRVKDRPPEVFRPHLDTVVIDTLANPRKEERPLTIEYVWRASVKAPRKMSDARVIVREVSGRRARSWLRWARAARSGTRRRSSASCCAPASPCWRR